MFLPLIWILTDGDSIHLQNSTRLGLCAHDMINLDISWTFDLYFRMIHSSSFSTKRNSTNQRRESMVCLNLTNICIEFLPFESHLILKLYNSFWIHFAIFQLRKNLVISLFQHFTHYVVRYISLVIHDSLFFSVLLTYSQIFNFMVTLIHFSWTNLCLVDSGDGDRKKKVPKGPRKFWMENILSKYL